MLEKRLNHVMHGEQIIQRLARKVYRHKGIVDEWELAAKRSLTTPRGAPFVFPEIFLQALRQLLRESVAQGLWALCREAVDLSAGAALPSRLSRIKRLGEGETEEDLGALGEALVAYIDGAEILAIPLGIGTIAANALREIRARTEKRLSTNDAIAEEEDEEERAAPRTDSSTKLLPAMIAINEARRFFQYGRILGAARSARNGYGDAVRFEAIIDERTTETCMSLDGVTLRIDDQRVADITPPLHVNCRSTLAIVPGYEADASAMDNDYVDSCIRSIDQGKASYVEAARAVHRDALSLYM